MSSQVRLRMGCRLLLTMLGWVLLSAALAVQGDDRTEPNLVIESASPSPNYSITVDSEDLRQLVDGKLSSYPTWVDRGSVGWSDQTPVLLRGRVNGGQKNSKIKSFRLRVAKRYPMKVVYPPRRIDLYCREGVKTWTHAGELAVVTERISDRAATWLDFPLTSSCADEFVLVMHAAGTFIMLDEIAVEVGNNGLDDSAAAGSIATDALISDSVKRLRVQLTRKENQQSAVTTSGAAGGAAHAWLADPWADLPRIGVVPKAGDRLADLAVANGSPVQYVLAIQNSGDDEREYSVLTSDELLGPAKFFRIAPIVAADGQTVYDPLIPLGGNPITVAAKSVEYVWLEHSIVKGDGNIIVTVSSRDDWRETLSFGLHAVESADLKTVRAPDVSVWAYSSDVPIWRSNNKPEVVAFLREAGVNVFVVHPDSIPLPGQNDSWHEREKVLRADLQLYKGAGTLLLFLGWNDRLASAYRLSGQFHDDLDLWLKRIDEVMRSEGFDYSQWALYPIDETRFA